MKNAQVFCALVVERDEISAATLFRMVGQERADGSVCAVVRFARASVLVGTGMLWYGGNRDQENRCFTVFVCGLAMRFQLSIECAGSA